MARVEADRHAGRVAGGVDRLQHGRDLLERVAKTRALASRRLDEDAGGKASGAGEGRGDAVRGPSHRLLARLFAGGSRMGHHPGDVEQSGTLKFGDESGDGFLP